MLHGVLGLCARSGALLFSKAWTPSFGLGGGKGGIGNGAPIDAINLSSLVFALQLNAAAAIEDDSDEEDVAVHGAAPVLSVDSEGPALRSVDMGAGVRVVFHSPTQLPGVLIALFAPKGEAAAVERRLLEDISGALAAKFAEQWAARPSHQVQLPVQTRECFNPSPNRQSLTPKPLAAIGDQFRVG